MRFGKFVPIIIVFALVIMAPVASAREYVIGWDERIDYIIPKTWVRPELNQTWDVSPWLKYAGVGHPYIIYNNTTVVLDDYYSRVYYRHLIIAPPAYSAKFTPHYDESVPLPDDLKNITREIAERSDTYYEFAINVAKFVHNTIKYEDVWYPEERMFQNGYATKDTLEKLLTQIWYRKKGVCRHMAILTVAMLEYAGVDARFVSGYAVDPVLTGAIRGGLDELVKVLASTNPNTPWLYIDLPREVKDIHNFTEYDFADLIGTPHAWVVYHDPGAGWIQLDPTNMIDILPSMPFDIPTGAGTMMEYHPYAEEAWPMFDIHILNVYHGGITRYTLLNSGKSIIDSEGMGIIVKNGDWLEYVPANLSIIVNENRGAKYSYSKIAENVPNMLQIYRLGDYLIFRTDKYTDPLYLANGESVTLPVKEVNGVGYYRLYRVSDIPIDLKNNLAILETPGGTDKEFIYSLIGVSGTILVDNKTAIVIDRNWSTIVHTKLKAYVYKNYVVIETAGISEPLRFMHCCGVDSPLAVVRNYQIFRISQIRPNEEDEIIIPHPSEVRIKVSNDPLPEDVREYIDTLENIMNGGDIVVPGPGIIAT